MRKSTNDTLALLRVVCLYPICPAQQHLFSAIGRDMTPSFLGGTLDFESVSRTWWDKMDAAMAERQAHPKGVQVCMFWGVGGLASNQAVVGGGQVNTQQR